MRLSPPDHLPRHAEAVGGLLDADTVVAAIQVVHVFDHSFLHDQGDPGLVVQQAEIVERVAIDDEQIGELAGLEGAEAVQLAVGFGGGAGSGDEDLHGRESAVAEFGQLPWRGVANEPALAGAGIVRAEGDLGPDLVRESNAGSMDGLGLAHLLQHPGTIGPSGEIAVAGDAQRGHEVEPRVLDAAYPGFVDESPVVDLVHPGLDRVADTSTPVKIMDYYASAVPCIMTNNANNSEIFEEDKDAWFCEFSKKAIKEKLEYILDLPKDEVAQVGLNGQERLLAVRNYKRIAADLAHQLNIL